MTPLVTVIIPTFNGAATIAEAIASIRAQDVAIEIIAVDDGSTDETPRVLEQSEVRVIRQANAGPAAARNSGLQHASAPFVAFLDDDDLRVRGSLRRQLELLLETPGGAATIGLSEHVSCDCDGVRRGGASEPRLLFSLGAALIRRTTFDRIGTFDPRLPGSEDVDWFLRLRDAGLQLLVTRDLIQTVRRTGENITRGKSLEELGFHAALRRSIRRRREIS